MYIYVQSPGTYITQKDGLFRFKRDDKRFDVAASKITSIVITNQASISTQAVVLALENNVDILFLNASGYPLGRIWLSKQGRTAKLRRKQLEATENGIGFEIVRDILLLKSKNQVRFLSKLKYARPGSGEPFEKAIATIEKAIEGISAAHDEQAAARNYLMGLEGSAGRAYFEAVSFCMPEKFRFGGRSRRPAKDPFNAALNYAYGMLYGEVEKTLIIAGLDPFIGFLHADRYNQASLVFDFIEPFRIIADQAVVYLFTGKKMKESFFTVSDCSMDGDGEIDAWPSDRSEPMEMESVSTAASVSLNEAGKPVLIEAVNQKLEETVRYRNKNVKTRHVMLHEARKMANRLLGEPDNEPDEIMELSEL